MALRTARNLVTDALRTAGAIDAIETPSAEETAHALNELNNMVAQFDLDNLVPYSQVVTTGTLTSAKALYSNGEGADIDIVRPNEIVTFAIDVGSVYRPLQKFTPVAYDNESLSVGEGGLPSIYTYRTSFPNGTLEVHPKPMSDYPYKMTTRFKSVDYGLNDQIQLPSGYYPMYQYNLAKLLLIHYPNPEKFAIVAQEADTMLSRIKRQNNKVNKMKNDYSGGGGLWDVRTDGYVR